MGQAYKTHIFKPIAQGLLIAHPLIRHGLPSGTATREHSAVCYLIAPHAAAMLIPLCFSARVAICSFALD